MQENFLNRLNPCCNGIYLIIQKRNLLQSYGRLNPCCNGIYLIIRVLSLTDKETCLNPCCNGIYLIIKRFKTLVAENAES